MSELPIGWAEASLLELTGNNGLMVDGDWVESKDQDPNGEVRLIQLADIGDRDFLDKSNRFLTLEKAKELRCTFLKKGDVLIARMPDPLGRACLFPDLDRLSVTVVDVCVWRSGSQSAYEKWIMYILNSPDIRNRIQTLASGTTRQRVSGGNLKKLSLAYPPLNEQRRIVAKLDRLFARSRCAREELGRVSGLVQRYKQAILAAAFRGDLTADWREDNPEVSLHQNFIQSIKQEKEYIELFPIPDQWQWVKWEDVLSLENGSFKRGPFGSALTKKIFVPKGYKVYEQYCPINDDCSFSRYYITQEKFKELESFSVRAGDFLISCSGVTLGRITQIPDCYEQGIINQALLRVRINNEIIGDLFFKTLFRSPYFQEQIFSNSSGTAIPNVKGVKELKAIPIPLPPVLEQKEIVRRIEKLFKAIDFIEQEHQKASKLLDRLEQATLSKAFRGELVPQDPNDEPAAVLLERIQSDRQAQPKRKAVKSKQSHC